MDVALDMEMVSETEWQYSTAIDSFRDDISLVRSQYESLHASHWRGQSGESFMASFREVEILWERVMMQLENTKQALGEVRAGGDPVITKSGQLM